MVRPHHSFLTTGCDSQQQSWINSGCASFLFLISTRALKSPKPDGWLSIANRSLVVFQTRVCTTHQCVQLSETEEELWGNLTVIHWGLWRYALMDRSQWLLHIGRSSTQRCVWTKTAYAELSRARINIHILIVRFISSTWLHVTFTTECRFVICVILRHLLSPVFAAARKTFTGVVLAHFVFLFICLEVDKTRRPGKPVPLVTSQRGSVHLNMHGLNGSAWESCKRRTVHGHSVCVHFPLCVFQVSRFQLGSLSFPCVTLCNNSILALQGAALSIY